MKVLNNVNTKNFREIYKNEDIKVIDHEEDIRNMENVDKEVEKHTGDDCNNKHSNNEKVHINVCNNCDKNEM
ncbi:MAG: hypothetical protein MJ191_04225 [Clostridium sp.]|nr:hypothetical protein [Clostridium sp.]